jgi:hypothetical protein
MVSDTDMEALAREKMYKNVIEYLPPKQPDADRVKELHYTSNQEGFFDRQVLEQGTGKLIGYERTPGDIPQPLKDEYFWLINKNYALGVVDNKDKQIDDINVKLGLILYNAQKSKKQRTIQEVANQHYAMMIHESEMTMSTGGFNRQVASTITQVQGQFFKVGKNVKDAARGLYEEMRGKDG